MITAKWQSRTTLDEIAERVPLLTLRNWLHSEYFSGPPQLSLRLVRGCATLGDLVSLVIYSSDRFRLRVHRPRKWYKSTFRNFLDHVPTDVTMFTNSSSNFQ